MSLKLFNRWQFTRDIIRRAAAWRIQEKIPEITRYLPDRCRVLDVGSGNCVLAWSLQNLGYEVTPMDIEDSSFVQDLHPKLYDGQKIPFADDTFDVALLITVLHHTPDPDAILAEVKRVAQRVIVIEEIYSTTFQKYVTFAIDSLFNLEFFGHPHTNRTDDQWKAAFNDLELRVEDSSYSSSLGCLSRVTYDLARQPSDSANNS